LGPRRLIKKEGHHKQKHREMEEKERKGHLDHPIWAMKRVYGVPAFGSKYRRPKKEQRRVSPAWQIGRHFATLGKKRGEFFR